MKKESYICDNCNNYKEQHQLNRLRFEVIPHYYDRKYSDKLITVSGIDLCDDCLKKIGMIDNDKDGWSNHPDLLKLFEGRC